MSTDPASIAVPVRRARSYGWRLALLIPAIGLAAFGYWNYSNLPAGGTVTSVKVTTKGDLAGQVRDAYASVDPMTSDYYLVVRKRDGTEQTTQTYKNTPLGSGLTWTLAEPINLLDVGQISVWDHHALLPDKQLDRVAVFENWAGVGQTFRVDLLGQHTLPPDWALPIAAVGATLFVVVLLRFVWDQAI